MSPRAGWRLEALGSPRSTTTWTGSSTGWLPACPPKAPTPNVRGPQTWRARTRRRADSMSRSSGSANAFARRAGTCVVVNDERVVLGLLRQEELERPEGRIEEVMRPGPSTFRPHVPIEEMADFMVAHDLPTSPITSSDGRLIGVLRREDAVHVAHQGHASEREEGDRAARHDPRLRGGERGA
jgi:CBS domain